jgi:hypothetical protein
MGSSRVKVLSIIGGTRSGSTLLDNLLGELDGFFSAGELHYLWERGLLQNRRCGCGQRLRDCDLWRRVLARSHRNAPRGTEDPHQVVKWQQHSVRVRHTWKLMRAEQPLDGANDPAGSYGRVLAQLYRSIAEETGARVVVDSSKRPSDALLSARLRGVDPYVLHLVRDPRAVTYSWRRRKQELDEDGADMPRHGPVYSSIRWLVINAVANLVRDMEFNGSALLLRYEDFVAAPRQSLLSILELVDEPLRSLPFVDDTTARLRPNHTAAGNPSRFDTGTIKLRPDNTWLTQLTPRDRLVTTGITLPLLHRYNYPIRHRLH